MNTQNEEKIIEELCAIRELLKSFGDFLPLFSQVVALRLECIEKQMMLVDQHLAVVNANVASMPGSAGIQIPADTICKL